MKLAVFETKKRVLMSPEEVHNFGSRQYIDKRGIPLICSLSGSFLESKNNKVKAPFTIFGERKKRLKKHF